MNYGTLAHWLPEAKGIRDKTEARSSLWPPLLLFFPEAGHKTPMWKVPSLCHSYHQRQGPGGQKAVWTNLFNSPLSSCHFSTIYCLNPNHCVLSIPQKCIVSLSKRSKVFLFWSLLWAFILLWRLLGTWKNSIKCVCFSPVCLTPVDS